MPLVHVKHLAAVLPIDQGEVDFMAPRLFDSTNSLDPIRLRHHGETTGRSSPVSLPASPPRRSGQGRKGKHLLDGLACNSELPSDIGLGIPRFNQAKHDFTTFKCQPPSLLRVFDRFSSNLFQTGEGVLIVRGDPMRHGAIMTTGGCRVNQPLSWPYTRRH